MFIKSKIVHLKTAFGDSGYYLLITNEEKPFVNNKTRRS